MACNYYDNCNHKDCDKPFCLKKYKLDCLYMEALLSDSQKRHVVLRVDEDRTDLAEFQRLVNIEKKYWNICCWKTEFIYSFLKLW